MGSPTPLTLNFDNQKRVVGIKELSTPQDECIGVEHGGLGGIVINSLPIVGDGENPVTTIGRIELKSTTGVTVTNTMSFLSNSPIDVSIANDQFEINSIMIISNGLPLNRIGSWVYGYTGFEGADDRLFLTTADSGIF